MRGPGKVCLRCQFRLLVASRTAARRGITSASAAAAFVERRGQFQAREDGQLRNGTQTSRNAVDGAPTMPTDPMTPATRTPRQSAAARRSPSSLAIFQSIVESQARNPSIPGATSGPTASIDLVKDVARMQTMLEREGATLAAAYSFFEENIHPQIAKDSTAVPQIVKNQIAAVLLNKLALEKPRDFESGQLPSVTRITELMIELDVLRPHAWATLVVELIQHIYRQNTVPDAYSSIQEYETALARRDGFLRDLLGAWTQFCAQSSSPDAVFSGTPLQADESTPDSSRADAKPRRPRTLQEAFGSLFPHYQFSTLLRPTFAAFATYKLLVDPGNPSRSIRGESAPFLQMMRKLISQSRPPRPDEFKTVFGTFRDLPRLMWPPKQCGKGDSSKFVSVSVLGDTKRNPMASIHRQVGDAMKSHNLGAVKKAWVEFWGEAPVPDAARVKKLAQNPDMFDYFILAYTMLRRPQQAIHVWDSMESIGLKATLKTWTSMMQGCVKANNAAGLKSVWDKLLASGLKPDTAVWTTRINGLFVCGEPDAGIRALDEMAKIWAARDDPQHAPIAVEPTVDPVNAALAGLLRLGRDADATNVLLWASKQGINPNIYTFNTLLRPLIRRGDMPGIDDIFATMRSVDIRPDVATFTVLLEGALSHIGDLPPEKQVAVVERVFDAMESAGVDVNMQNYAKILHLLLREGDRAEEPVKAVLAHIWRRGLELTSHIYTMLAGHYFARDPPDAAAVTALIENRRLHENRGIDRVFWERVIGGYAQAGETRRALDIFDRVFGTGAAVTINPSTLYDLLRPLVEAGDLQAAQRVVDAARKIGKMADAGHGDGRRFWKHRFWHLAYEQGLLSESLAERFRMANGQGGL